MIGDEASAGLWAIIRLIVRRDRLRISAWIGGVVALMVGSGASLPNVYDSPEAIRSYVEIAGGNPALVVFAGPGYGFDQPNIGVVLVNETLLWGTIATSLMSIFMVVRHTRAEEEGDRTELLRSSVVGRHASLAAALVVVAVMNVLVTAATTVGFVAEGYAISGSIAIAAAIGAAGLVFAGLAGVSAQLFDHARGALGWTSSGLGLAFAIRGVGDVTGNGVSWLSPLGWAHATRPFADERWSVLALSTAFFLATAAAAFTLSTRRDLGRGLLTERPGPASADPWMVSPIGLTFRLQRGTIAGWSFGLAITGLLFGAVGNDVERLVEDNPELAAYLAQLGGASITDAYFATSVQMMAMLATGFALSSILRARTEELAGLLEPVIATPTSRTSWWLSHVGVCIGGTVIITAVGGLGVGVAYALVARDSGQIIRLAVAALVTLPAVLALVGLALVFLGRLPRWILLNWVVFAGVVVIGVFGETLRLPQWLRNLSPFEHLPDAPADTIDLTPLIVLTGLAAALGAGGWHGFRNRDLAAS